MCIIHLRFQPFYIIKNKVMRQKTLTNSQLLDAIRNRANKFQLTEHFATAQNYLSTARSFSQYINLRGSAHV